MPDSAHINASDAVVSAIKQYAKLGGKLMLVDDAGALTDGGFYPLAGNSRFADLAGVDHVLHGELRDQVAGFGPVVGTRARLDSLSMSVQPRGAGGLVFNWHVDDGDDLLVNTKYLLDKTDVCKRGPHSIHFTAGPDVINFGDGNGMNLPADK